MVKTINLKDGKIVTKRIGYVGNGCINTDEVAFGEVLEKYQKYILGQIPNETIRIWDYDLNMYVILSLDKITVFYDGTIE